GLGLGHRFLRHLERTKVLVHVVDVSGASGRNQVDDLEVVRRELELFQPVLAMKPQLVAANKLDTVAEPDTDVRVGDLRRRARDLKLPFFAVSAATGAGLPDLLEAMWQRLAKARQSAA